MFVSHEFLRNLIQGYTWLSHRSCDVSGNTSLPHGAKIIALNHTNGCDPFFLPLIINESLHFLLQDGLFKIPVVGSLLKRSGQIPVYRGTNRAMDAFDQACHLLREGKTIVIFPEGRLVPAGRRIQAKTGTIRMALEIGAPIIPGGLYVPPRNLINVKFNSHGCPRSGLCQLTGKSYMRFGAAWDPSDRPAQANDLNCRVMTDELMNRIYTLVTEIEKEIPCVSHTLLNPVFQ